MEYSLNSLDFQLAEYSLDSLNSLDFQLVEYRVPYSANNIATGEPSQAITSQASSTLINRQLPSVDNFHQ